MAYESDYDPQRLNGVPGSPYYDDGHANANGHNHFGFLTQDMAAEAVAMLRANGIQVTEWSGDGKDTVAGVHRDPGHYDGRSFDVPAAQWSPGKPDSKKEIDGMARVDGLIDQWLKGKKGGSSTTSSSGPTPAGLTAAPKVAEVEPLKPMAPLEVAGAPDAGGLPTVSQRRGLEAGEPQRMAGSGKVKQMLASFIGDDSDEKPLSAVAGRSRQASSLLPPPQLENPGNWLRRSR